MNRTAFIRKTEAERRSAQGSDKGRCATEVARQKTVRAPLRMRWILVADQNGHAELRVSWHEDEEPGPRHRGRKSLQTRALKFNRVASRWNFRPRKSVDKALC